MRLLPLLPTIEPQRRLLPLFSFADILSSPSIATTTRTHTHASATARYLPEGLTPPGVIWCSLIYVSFFLRPPPVPSPPPTRTRTSKVTASPVFICPPPLSPSVSLSNPPAASTGRREGGSRRRTLRLVIAQSHPSTKGTSARLRLLLSVTYCCGILPPSRSLSLSLRLFCRRVVANLFSQVCVRACVPHRHHRVPFEGGDHLYLAARLILSVTLLPPLNSTVPVALCKNQRHTLSSPPSRRFPPPLPHSPLSCASLLVPSFLYPNPLRCSPPRPTRWRAPFALSPFITLDIVFRLLVTHSLPPHTHTNLLPSSRVRFFWHLTALLTPARAHTSKLYTRQKRRHVVRVDAAHIQLSQSLCISTYALLAPSSLSFPWWRLRRGFCSHLDGIFSHRSTCSSS